MGPGIRTAGRGRKKSCFSCTDSWQKWMIDAVGSHGRERIARMERRSRNDSQSLCWSLLLLLRTEAKAFRHRVSQRWTLSSDIPKHIPPVKAEGKWKTRKEGRRSSKRRKEKRKEVQTAPELSTSIAGVDGESRAALVKWSSTSAAATLGTN